MSNTEETTMSNTKETTVVHLTGPAARGVRVGAPMLRDLLDALVDAVQQSVRVRAEGRSRAAGPTPAWLDRAAAFAVEIPVTKPMTISRARCESCHDCGWSAPAPRYQRHSSSPSRQSDRVGDRRRI